MKNICTVHTRKACRHCKLSCHLCDFVHHLPLLRGVHHDNHDDHLLGYEDTKEIFRIIRKISSLSGNFLGYPETFRTIQHISTLSRNFPKGPESPHCNFRVYSQNLSERAKTFRMAMPPCYPGFWASGYHNARSRVNQSPS